MQMLKKRKTTKYVILCIALLVCITIAILSGAQPYNTAVDTPITPTENATLNNTYGAFYHGSTYRYTDYRKVEDMHSGAITDDTTVVTVDGTKAHGSQENPFVIDSVSVWNAFVADMADTSSGVLDCGKNKYFVLAKDLDFNGLTFKPVNCFKGTFYGLGYTISNVTLSNLNSYGGLFNYGYGFTITDLNNSSYSYTDVKRYVGGIVGAAIEDYQILNCHTKGSILGLTQTGYSYQIGGIVGFSSGGDNIASSASNVNHTVYRCSAEYSASGIRTTSTDAPVVGGIIGSVWHKSNPSILDCYSIVKAGNNNLTNDSALYAGVVGIVCESGALSIENCATDIYIDNLELIKYPMLGGLGGIWMNNTAYQTSSITVKNVYLVSQGRNTGGADVTFYPFTNYYYQDNVVNNINFDFLNVNYAGNGSIYGYNYSVSGVKGTVKAISASTMLSSVSDLWAAAKDGSNALSASIWDKDKINTNYSIEDSPVINNLQKEQFDVEFYNYKNSADEGIGIASIKYDYGSMGITLSAPTAPDANHKFVGWTTDKSGEQDPFT
ncbi:MAG: hypothetical protein K2L70_05875, partial [Clostridia bacterium]|nr:hypothetical protein [Clostridia bacterium]